MPLDDLPGQILIPTRDDIIAKWKRDYIVRVPTVDAADPQLDVDARVCADALLPIYAASKTIGNNCVLEQATGLNAVSAWGEREGVDGPNPANGASGYGTVVASSGGTALELGDELLHEPTQTSYKCTKSGTYFQDDHVPIAGVDTGPQTNIAGGSILKWKSPRPGSGQTITVVTQPDGSGLSGGNDAETTAGYQLRIRAEKINKAASGNDADYQSTTAKTPDVSVQKVFTWPAITGTGTTAVGFTLNPARPGATRVPNSAQMSLAEELVTTLMPVDDGAYFILLGQENADPVYQVTWSSDAAGWVDVVQWPPYYPLLSGPLRAIVVSSVTSSTVFSLKTADGVYTSVAQPQVGQTIAFFDATYGLFRKKRILSFTGTGPWAIVADTTNNSSETTYVPVVSQRAMPWSESLPAILSPLFKYFDGLGPGEMVSVFYDEGARQRRQPQAPKEWPSTLTRKGLEQAIEISEIDDGSVVEGDGLSPTIGTPGIVAHILALRYVAVFAE